MTRRQRTSRAWTDYTPVTPTAAERTRRGTDPRVRFGQCKECGARLWLSGLGIGSHERSKRHLAPMLRRQALEMERRAAAAGIKSDREWYAAEAARLRELAR
jgi:hypothetical protein